MSSMDTLLHTILSNTYTRSDFYHRYALIREFADSISYRDVNESNKTVLQRMEDYFEKKGEDKRHRQALREWGEDVWNIMLSGDINQNLTRLRKQFEELAVIVLYVPTSFTASQLDIIGKRLRDYVGDQVIFDIEVSTEVAGGCAFSYKGRYYDLSFGQRLVKHHDDIVDMIRNFKQDIDSRSETIPT